MKSTRRTQLERGRKKEAWGSGSSKFQAEDKKWVLHVKGSERKPGQLLRGRERKVEALIAMNREWSKGRRFAFFIWITLNLIRKES